MLCHISKDREHSQFRLSISHKHLFLTLINNHAALLSTLFKHVLICFILASFPLSVMGIPLQTDLNLNGTNQAKAGQGSIIYTHFDKIGVLTASKLTKEERAKVIASVKNKFKGTDVTITDSAKEFNELVKKNPKKTAHKIYVTSRASSIAGHAAHSGDNGKVYDSKYITVKREPKFDELRKDPKDPKSPLDSDKLVNAIENTVAHEIGHLLGLDDDKDSKSKPHIMQSPANIKDDVTSLSFSDSDKAIIKNGKSKESTPDQRPKKKALYPVRGAGIPVLPDGVFERTDWVPLRYTTSLDFSVGYINFFGDFYPLSEIAGNVGEFNLAPSVGFDLALNRLSDGTVFPMSEFAVEILTAGELSGSQAFFPFEGIYHDNAVLLFDITGDGQGDTSLFLASSLLDSFNGLSLTPVPYAAAIPEPNTQTLFIEGLLAVFATMLIRARRLARRAQVNQTHTLQRKISGLSRPCGWANNGLRFK